MSVAVRQDTEWTVQEFVQLIVERAVEEGTPPSVVVLSTDFDALCPEAFRELARVGAVRMANDELHELRRGVSGEGDEGDGPRPGPAGRSSTAWRDQLWMATVTLVGADGVFKPVTRFGVNDLDALKATAKVNESAWRDRSRWAAKAVALLTEHGAAIVAGLPRDVLLGLDEQAKEVWSR
jgi:hypothetical protein